MSGSCAAFLVALPLELRCRLPMDRPPRLLTALCRSQVGAANQIGTVPSFEPITCLSFVVIVQDPHVPLSALSRSSKSFPLLQRRRSTLNPLPHFHTNPSHAHCQAKQTTQGVFSTPNSHCLWRGRAFYLLSNRPPGRKGVQYSGTRPSRGPSIGSLHQRLPFSFFSHTSSSSPLEPPLAD